MHLKRLHALINVLVIAECSAAEIAAIDSTTSVAATARNDADKARGKLNAELLALEAQFEALSAELDKRNNNGEYEWLKSEIRNWEAVSRTHSALNLALCAHIKALSAEHVADSAEVTASDEAIAAGKFMHRVICKVVDEVSLRAKIEAVIAQMKHTSRKYSVDLQYDTGYDHAINAFTDQLKDALKWTTKPTAKHYSTSSTRSPTTSMTTKSTRVTRSTACSAGQQSPASAD